MLVYLSVSSRSFAIKLPEVSQRDYSICFYWVFLLSSHWKWPLIVGEEIIYDVVISMLKTCEARILKMETSDVIEFLLLFWIIIFYSHQQKLFQFLRSELVTCTFQQLEKDFSKLTKDVVDLWDRCCIFFKEWIPWIKNKNTATTSTPTAW